MNKLLSVNNQGNLINEHLLLELSNEKTKYKFAQPDSFRWFGDDALDTPHILNLIIANRYEDLVARWDMYFNDFEKYSISELRERWIKPFFAAFSYDLQFQRGDVHSGDFTFYLSHRGWDQESAPYIHSVQWDQYLDAKTSDGRNTYSPHDTMQRFLISSKEHTWGIVTNGKKLRLLRDFHHETRKAYIEFDLETLFQGRNFSDFRLLWRLIHPSRFFPTPDSNESRLEQMFVESKAAGVSIGEDLKLNVRIAIEELANGFLYSTHGLTDKLVDDPTKCAEFHHQLLRVIYRILFLLYAEQRNLMPIRSSLYFKEYSISAIREKIESGMILEDDFTDLWEGLKVTFEMVHQGVGTMGIPNYNGLLFDPGEIEWLASCTCKNNQLLTAIRYMTTMEKGGLLQRISYVELDVDEIGAIYESLLDYIPRVSSQRELFEDVMLIDGKHKNTTREIASRTFFLDPRGTNRKSSGTYYTNPGLVNALIESALKPVMEQRLAGAEKDKESQINALLSLDVCDPAAGSGAFLIASTEFLGEKLAVLQTQDEYPSDKAIRHARRDVLRHCIYGVDLNPLAVELCKVSLWLISATDDLPLNFLDHHIKCGNSLIGTTPELIKKGIPPDAFNPVIGDEKHVCTERKKQARNDVKDLKSGQLYGMFMPKSENLIFTQKTDFAEEYSENTTDEINELIQDYQHSQRDESFTYKKFIADYWTAAFFWQHKDLAKSPLERGAPNDFGTGCVRPSQWLEKQDDSSPPQRSEKEYPNNHILFDLMKGNREAMSPEIASEVKELAGNYKFFHWYLEFPKVFEKGGFDCMLGNPPWDNVQPEEKQFFATYDPEIAEMSGNNRKKAIESLIESNSDLYEKWNKFKRDIYVFSRFVRESGKYFLTARGKLNLYPIFAETFKDHINEHGRAGFIVPTGIATDDSTKAYFGNLIDTKSLVSLFDFENREKLFQDVDSRMKFCLLTVSGKETPQAEFSFFSTNLDHLNENIRCFSLAPEDINRINPNTKTTPVFRTKVDAELTKKIYQQVPVLINEENDVNPWEISFRQGLFNMASDSHLFHTEPAEDRVPLYEAKMIWHYDHRFGTFEGYDDSTSSSHLPIPTIEQYNDPHFGITPRYWVDELEVLKRLAYPRDKETREWFKNLNPQQQREYLEENAPKWLLGFRDITNSTNERTFITSILPSWAISNKLPLIHSQYSQQLYLLNANLTSIIFDFIPRQKIGGTSMNFYLVKQLPVLTPDFYSEEDIAFIKPRVLELVYTAYDLKPFAEDMGYTGEPFKWDEERRANLKAELDAYYAKLYGLNRKQLRYILDPADLTPSELESILDDWEEVENPLIESEYKKRCAASTFPGETFRVLKDKDIRNYGEYRTRRLVLEKWEEMSGEKN